MERGAARVKEIDYTPRMNELRLRPIGVVRNGRTSTEDRGWGALECAAGLEGLESFSHAIVLFFMHEDPDREPPTMRRRPRGRADMPLLGVFAQRGRMRPNPVGITTVEVVRVDPPRLVVRRLDAIDGTPVLDIKPWVPVFDAAERPRVPEWVGRLMQSYFEEP
jgi:tRNA (adenine37-N6)-methyltransferase